MKKVLADHARNVIIYNQMVAYNLNEVRETLFLRAPIATVWKGLTTTEGLMQWFCNLGVEGEIAPEAEVVFVFAEGRSRAKIHTVEPYSFSFSWVPGVCFDEPLDEDLLVRTTFTLREEEQGTMLEVIESGFEKLPEWLREKATALNQEGWQDCLNSLQKALLGDQVPDTIYCSLFIKAPIETVWSGLTDPEVMKGAWNMLGIVGRIEEGQECEWSFEGFKNAVRYVDVQPSTQLSFEWVPAESAEIPVPKKGTTLVTFKLRSYNGGTMLMLTESGFAKLDRDPQSRMEMNRQGWVEEVLPPFATYMEGLVGRS